MSCKISKSGVVNSKVLMTKWDVNSVDRLTRADFYNDHFQPRDAFLIPHGVSYPNERTMLKAMNEIQSGLKHGGGKEWRVVQGRRGARVVRLYDPSEAVKDRNPPPPSVDVTRENAPSSQLRRRESSTTQRSQKTEAKRSDASPTAKKAPRSIFTVHERRSDAQGQSHQEAVIGSLPAKVGRKKGMEKRDLELAIHGLEDFEQYTHDQLQKILDVNKRFFKLNQKGPHPSKLSTKQIKNVLNSQEAPKRNKMLNSLESQRAERTFSEETMGENVCSEVGMRVNVRSDTDARKKNCVSEKDNKSHELSDAWSDEKYVFAGYQENSESSLFDSDSNNCDNLFPEPDREMNTMVTSVENDTTGDVYIPPIHRTRHTVTRTGLGTGDQIGLPASKLKKRFATGGVILNETEGGGGEATSFVRDDHDSKKFTNRFTIGDVTLNGIGEGGDEETVGFHVKSKPTSKRGEANGSRFSVHTAQGRIRYDTRSVNEYSRVSCKPLRKEPPATSSIGSSHAVNQRKKNLEIDRENNRLSAKLEQIKTTPPRNSITFRTSRQEQLPFARIQRRVANKSMYD